MIPLPEDFVQRLGAEVTTLAFCWRLVRADGVALGFTSHDHDLEIDGLVYRAAPGIAPSALHLSGTLETDSMDIAGALSSDAITETDLMSGRYDDARVSLFLVDWTAPDTGRLPLMRGRLGMVTGSDNGFTAELHGPAEVLDRPATELLSPECRAQLGDRHCRVDLNALTVFAQVTEIVSPQTVEVGTAEPSPNAYAYGRARFLTGANSGLERAIAGSDGAVLYLAEPPAHALAPGDRVELRQGCDKRFATCRERFGNAANFKGEPHVPGNDLLTRYPGL